MQLSRSQLSRKEKKLKKYLLRLFPLFRDGIAAEVLFVVSPNSRVKTLLTKT